MNVATLKREVAKLQAVFARPTPATNPMLARLRTDPTAILSETGMVPDHWQATVLRSLGDRQLLLCSRQSGKSQTSSALALRIALLNPSSLILLLSPSQRQSSELFRKLLSLYSALGRPVPKIGPRDNALKLELANGSRVVSLPGNEETVRCFSGVSLLIVDEAARVPDALYYAVRPMLAVSKGRLVALSTPFGKRGWFWEEWHSGRRWQRVKITAHQCPRISAEFLEEERQSLGERWFAQEYLCSFEDTVGAVFDADDIERAFMSEAQPLFG